MPDLQLPKKENMNTPEMIYIVEKNPQGSKWRIVVVANGGFETRKAAEEYVRTTFGQEPLRRCKWGFICNREQSRHIHIPSSS